MDLLLLACNGFFISKFVTDSFPPLMACHRFFMKMYGFFMKALPISECYCNSKRYSICSCHCRADCMVTLMELQRLDQQSFQPNVCLDQNKCLGVSTLEKRGMVGRHYYLSHLMTKPTKWHVRPAKTQISLGILLHCPH